MTRLLSVLISFILLTFIVTAPFRAKAQSIVSIAIYNLATFDVKNESLDLLMVLAPNRIQEPQTQKHRTFWAYTYISYNNSSGVPCRQLVEFSIEGQIARVPIEVVGNEIVIDDEEPVPLDECFDGALRLIVGIGAVIPPDKLDEIQKNPTAAGLATTTIFITDKSEGHTNAVVRGEGIYVAVLDSGI